MQTTVAPISIGKGSATGVQTPFQVSNPPLEVFVEVGQYLRSGLKMKILRVFSSLPSHKTSQ